MQTEREKQLESDLQNCAKRIIELEKAQGDPRTFKDAQKELEARRQEMIRLQEHNHGLVSRTMNLEDMIEDQEFQIGRLVKETCAHSFRLSKWPHRAASWLCKVMRV